MTISEDAANPQQIGRPDPVRGRIPINFPPPVVTTARNAAEWIEALAEGECLDV